MFLGHCFKDRHLKKKSKFIVKTFLRSFQNQMKTHYDVLNLAKTCTSKEIKDSFIKLSKKYHPDKNKSSDAHKKFIEVNEAYSVLGKPDTRCKYDESLLFEARRVVYQPGPSPSTVRTPYEHYVHMHRNINRAQQETGHITTSKIKALVFCCILMVIGSGFQLRSEMRKRERRSHEIAVYFKNSSERIRRLRERKNEIEKSSVPTTSFEKEDLQK